MNFFRKKHTDPPRPLVQPKPLTQLPQQQRSSEWKIGWKIANLLIASDGTVCFTSIVQDGIVRPYHLDDVAECTQYPSHDAPEATHHCGFNAFNERSAAERYRDWLFSRPAGDYRHRENIVLLRVGLYGRVQEGTLFPQSETWGYKASRQRVADIFIPPRCIYSSCTEVASHVGVASGDRKSEFSRTQYLRSLCEQHALTSSHTFSMEHLNRLTQATFRWEES